METRDLIEARPDGYRLEMVWDDTDRKVRFYEATDAEAVVDANMKAQNNGKGWMDREKSWRHVARLDPVHVHMLKQSGIWDDPKALRRWLDDLDHMKLRTDRCRLGR